MEAKIVIEENKQFSLRDLSFALRSMDTLQVVDDSFEALEHLDQFKNSKDNMFNQLMLFFSMNLFDQRKVLKEKGSELINRMLWILKELDYEMSVLSYMLPLIDGILFGRFTLYKIYRIFILILGLLNILQVSIYKLLSNHYNI